MFAGAGTLHGNGTFCQSVHECFGTLHFAHIIRVQKQEKMEITIPHMPDNWRYQACFGKVFFRLADAIGQTRNRYADIGGNTLATGPQQKRCKIGVVTRPP